MSDFTQSTDAREWAEAFCQRFSVVSRGSECDPDDDEGLMIGWFANAIERGRDAGSSVGVSDFVLDRTENPHPKMLAGAIQARRTARALGGGRTVHYWVGYLQAMCDATGESAKALNAWLDRQEQK